MGDADNVLPPSKKRAAGRQLSRDNPGLDDEEETSEQETGTFIRASDEVMAGRRIVKVRRPQASSTPSAPSSNPFAAIRLVPPTNSMATPVEVATKAESEKTVVEEVVKEIEEINVVNQGSEKEKTVVEEVVKEIEEINVVNQGSEKEKDKNGKQDEPGAESTADDEEVVPDKEPTRGESANVNLTEDKAEIETETGEKNYKENKEDNGGEYVVKSAEPAPFSSFGQLSSGQNAFSGLAGATFPSSTFSFGPIPKDSGSVFGEKKGQPSISFGLSNNGNSSLFGTLAPPIVNKNEASGFPSMQEVPVETGEENEKAVFTADSVVFEFLNGGWKERGKGELKVNVPTTGTGKARLVMRAKGNYRLILNASLYPDMKLTNLDKRGITFACVNSASEGKDGLSTFALKFRDASFVEEFRAAVTEHKGNAAVVKTPENSPKALDD